MKAEIILWTVTIYRNAAVRINIDPVGRCANITANRFFGRGKRQISRNVPNVTEPLTE